MRENKLVINTESGNVYCDNFSTNESIYDFLLAQQVYEKNFAMRGGLFKINK